MEGSGSSTPVKALDEPEWALLEMIVYFIVLNDLMCLVDYP